MLRDKFKVVNKQYKSNFLSLMITTRASLYVSGTSIWMMMIMTVILIFFRELSTLLHGEAVNKFQDDFLFSQTFYDP